MAQPTAAEETRPDVLLSYDSEERAYYIEVESREYGPLTERELEEVKRCLNA